MSDKNVVGLR